MGILADSFRARLDEMKARHEETDRELNEARDAVHQALHELNRIADEF